MSAGKEQATGRTRWLVIGFAYLAGLLWIGWYFHNALNTDAVAYLRIASYYASGKLDLAITGYWGPLLSWLMALPIKAGLPDLVVARGVMVLSALVFLGGCMALYRVLVLSPKWLLTGAILAAACGLYWSVRFITPDLLLAGLVAFAMSLLLKAEDSSRNWNDFLAGVIWGLAYLAKAVALPLGVLTMFSLAVIHFAEGAQIRRFWLGKTLLALVGFAVVAGPWVFILSLKYGRPTFSTSAAISHAITGPADMERYHPFARIFHKPEPGRITSWEEPSRMPYHYWSPLASPAYAWHQLKILLRNIVVCLILLTSLEVAWLIPAFYLISQILPKNSPNKGWPAQMRVLLVPLLLEVLYLPTSVNLAEQRFFYPAFPFLFAAVALWANQAFRHPSTDPPSTQQERTWWLAVLGALAPLLTTIVLLGNSPKYAGDYAVDLARRLQAANLAGPIAGSGLLPGGRSGLYVAFLINQPWYGDEENATPESLRSSGARLVVVIRQSQLARELDRAPGFTNGDAALFENQLQSARFPLQVYAVRDWPAARR